jgi:heme/copper-type cytochrome/quinol oxidase subunit 3
MSARTAARVAWSLWALSVLLAAFATLFYFLSLPISLEGRDRPPLEFLPVLLIAVLTFSTMGALVASRRPANAIGWIFCAVGIFLGAAFSAQSYADYTLIVRPGSLPGGEIAIWSLLWAGPVLSAAPTFLLLLFPDGRLPSRRWRPVAWLAAGAMAIGIVGLAFKPGKLDEDYPSVTNPFGIEGGAGDVLDLMSSAGAALATLALLLSLISMILRFLRSRGDERQQLKWIAYAGGVMVAAFLVAEVIPGEGLIADLLWATGFIALVGLPVAAGVAILKYRLYDIDIVINRTLVYAVLTATLASVYFGGVVSLQSVFRAFTGQESQLAVVASTLAIAALFQPLRRRIQDFIDRRFYRRKYDAEKTLAAFSARLRDEVDLDALCSDLVGVVEDTMLPEHVSLWLRPPQRGWSEHRSRPRDGERRQGDAPWPARETL